MAGTDPAAAAAEGPAVPGPPGAADTACKAGTARGRGAMGAAEPPIEKAKGPANAACPAASAAEPPGAAGTAGAAAGPICGTFRPERREIVGDGGAVVAAVAVADAAAVAVVAAATVATAATAAAVPPATAGPGNAVREAPAATLTGLPPPRIALPSLAWPGWVWNAGRGGPWGPWRVKP